MGANEHFLETRPAEDLQGMHPEVGFPLLHHRGHCVRSQGSFWSLGLAHPVSKPQSSRDGCRLGAGLGLSSYSVQDWIG